MKLLMTLWMFVSIAFGVTVRLKPKLMAEGLSELSRVAIFSSLRYDLDRTRKIFIRLLTTPKMHFRKSYMLSRLQGWQCTWLFNAFFPYQSLHDLVFPFALLNINKPLRLLIVNRINEFHPHLMELKFVNRWVPNASHYSSALMQQAGSNAHRYGDSEAAIWAIRNKLFPILSEVEHGRWGPFLECLLYAVLRLPRTPKCVTVIQDFSCRESLINGDYWSMAYQSSVAKFKQHLFHLAKGQRSLWRCILLLTLFSNPKLPRRLDDDEYDQMNGFIRDFFIEYQVDDIPPFLRKPLIRYCVQHRIHIDVVGNSNLKGMIRRLEELYPTLKSIGGSREDYLDRWRFTLMRRNRARFIIPPELMNLDEAMEWWSGARVEDDISYPPPRKLPGSVTLLGHHITVTCDSFRCFLRTLTDMLMEVGSLLRTLSSPGKLAASNLRYYVLRAFVRTIVYNLYFFGSILLPIPIESLTWIFRSSRADSHNHQLLYMACERSLLRAYIPMQFLIMPKNEEPGFWTMDEVAMAVLVTVFLSTLIYFSCNKAYKLYYGTIEL